MTIPKIIWAIWCNFDGKTDGTLTDRLTYFKDRITTQHPGWSVNIITKWNELIDYFKEDENLLKIVNNSFISAQHKSDAIRFFLLKKHGGFWIDISTFLLTPLDIYYEKQPNATFISYYSPPLIIEEIIFSSLSQMVDSVKFDKIIEQMQNIQPNYIKLKEPYKDFPFMPENFFIASIPNHPIINDIYEQLLSFWNIAIPKIDDKKSLCYQINLLMNKLGDELFDINNLDYELSKKYLSSDVTDHNFSENLLTNVWNCGYLFNYLQMYIAIVNYIKKYKCEITQESNSRELRSEYRADLCFTDDISNGSIDSCKNIIINNSSDGSVGYLLSLSYNRLLKWANTMEDRVSFNNTYIKDRLDEIGTTPDEASKEKILQDIIDAGIYQIKFSSWTRGSGIIERFMKLYPNVHSGGLKNKKKSRKTKKRKNQKRKTHSKSKNIQTIKISTKKNKKNKKYYI